MAYGVIGVFLGAVILGLGYTIIFDWLQVPVDTVADEPANDGQLRLTHYLQHALLAFLGVTLSACAAVGPEYVRPDSPLGPDRY